MFGSVTKGLVLLLVMAVGVEAHPFIKPDLEAHARNVSNTPFIKPDLEAHARNVSNTDSNSVLPASAVQEDYVAGRKEDTELFLYLVSSGGLWIGTWLDGHETDRLVKTGRYQEGNPLLRASGGGLNKAALYGSSALVQTGSAYLFLKGHRKAAYWTNFAIGGAHFIIGLISLRRK